MGFTITYKRAAELPGIYLPWQYQVTATTWADLDLSSGYTLTCTLTNASTTVVTTPSAALTGALGAVSVAWAAADLDLAPGVYQLKIKAVENATSKDRWWSPESWPLVRIVD